MSRSERLPIVHWIVDYGDGRPAREITIPHSWRQEVSVEFEGPVTYHAALDVPDKGGILRFYGVSYAAEVFANDKLVGEHKGIWDAFDIDLSAYAGERVRLSVRVVKNGGSRYPVNAVASGFLPYVFNTFGGLYRRVELVPVGSPMIKPVLPSRVEVHGNQIFVDGQPFYARGLLHWGWYPEYGHPTPDDGAIRREVRAVKSLDFNVVKFCLWVPPHRYLQILEEEGLMAWLELPLWEPSRDGALLDDTICELERIVRQYRHHSNILFWTAGCQLGGSVAAKNRSYLEQMLQNLTGSPLTKDSSGGAEMFGGDLTEFGTFNDFHPYCDTPFYPSTLDSLLNGPRNDVPVVLGEHNDVDVHRDLTRIADEIPYWASALSELNAQGVRWQYDLPAVIARNRFAHEPGPSSHSDMIATSREKALFVRKTVAEAVRSRAFAGYVVTGWRDTPITTSGFFDDWGDMRFLPEECAAWNREACIFLIPSRRPLWTTGGNRPGNADTFNHFVGQIFLRVGVHTQSALSSGLTWRILDAQQRTVARGAKAAHAIEALKASEVGFIDWFCDTPGEYRLEVEFGTAKNSWPLWVVSSRDWESFSKWGKHDPDGCLADAPLDGSIGLIATRWTETVRERLGSTDPTLVILNSEGTVPQPFWRSATYEYAEPKFWDVVPFMDRWERLLAVSPDRVIDVDWLTEQIGTGFEILMNRVDTRTYEEAPILVRMGSSIVTTLRPFGGLGSQPPSLSENPAGFELLRSLTRHLTETR